MHLIALPLLALLPMLSGAVAAAEPAVPPALQPWVAWVLHPLDQRDCPVDPRDRDAGGAPRAGSDERRICAWPGRLELDLEADGGRFTQGWQVYAQTWVPLPGDDADLAAGPARRRSAPGSRHAR